MKNVIDKARAAAKEVGLSEDMFMACERGASFGYNNLVSDMRSLAIMRETNAPIVLTPHILCSSQAVRELAVVVSVRWFLF
jgi:3-deoxy-D-manno-octulosonic acid (KDO) 8-phosphate synthase